jgi:hypothetical protein
MGNKGSQWMTLALVTSLARGILFFTSRCSASDVFCNPGLALFLYTKYRVSPTRPTTARHHIDVPGGSSHGLTLR